ncbi:helix-turn-helix protein [Roseiarcus fermentans]|uniref:Helix-turn-helix protein n=1 Tax=Roseiarcus fermentans TaxID=1473586 RepID=A0A366FM36_9HYPH|nr:AraC family transcriptional regulator [Roseiarcus fermentans]RBP15754.1 helix-turn-helix protein [Roseiarcus fermentans]
MIVAYCDGTTQMNRRCAGDWRNERVGPGVVSLLTHAAQSHWRWSVFRDEGRCGGFSHVQAKTLANYVDEHLERALSLDELAGVVRLSAFHFARKFREEFGCPAYAYVVRRRIERARGLLENPAVPLKAVAAACGFFRPEPHDPAVPPGHGRDARGLPQGEDLMTVPAAARRSKIVRRRAPLSFKTR